MRRIYHHRRASLDYVTYGLIVVGIPLWLYLFYVRITWLLACR